MKSYSAYFVRAAALDGARAVFGTSVQPVPDSPWLLCGYCPDDELPDDDVLLGEASLTQAKSAALGEVFFVYGDTSVDWFVYEHAQGGELLRKLVWTTLPEGDGDACGWTLVEGAPEPWEAALPPADSPITAGQISPACDGTVAMLVEKSYGIDRFGRSTRHG